MDEPPHVEKPSLAGEAAHQPQSLAHSEADSSDGPRWRQLALVFVGYLALAIVATWPLAVRAGDHVFGVGTPDLNIWAMGWVLHQLPRDPLHLFDANAFYPYRDSLAFSEHLFVPALHAAPVVAATGNLVLGHNIVALITLATAGFGMFLLARELVGDDYGAFAAGALYAFHTWNINELIRIQILSNQWFPFLLFGLVRFFRNGAARWAWASALFYVLQSLSGMYWALYAPFVLSTTLAALQLRFRRSMQDLVRLAVPLLVAGAVSAVFFVPYLRSARDLGFVRAAPDSISFDRFGDVLRGNVLYGRMLDSARPNQDAAHFLGFAALALALVGLAAARGRWPAFDRVRWLLLSFVVGGFLLSAGPVMSVAGTEIGPGPYAAVRAYVPGFQNVRYPERFALVLVLGFAPLVGAGVSVVRRRLGAIAAAALTAFVFLEHLSSPLPLVSLPGPEGMPSVYRWLADDNQVHVIAEVPEGHYLMDRDGARQMYFSMAHWKPILQGLTGYFPPAYSYARWRLFSFPSPESVHFLEEMGVDTVVVRPELAHRVPPNPRWETIGPFAEGHMVLRLRHSRSGPLPAPQPTAGLREVSRQNWAVAASVPGPGKALDGDLRTAWTTIEEPRPFDFIRVVLPAPERLSRVSIGVGPPYEFPTDGVRVIGEDSAGHPTELAHDEAASYDRLLAGLVNRPLEASLDLDFEPGCYRAIRLRVRDVDSFLLPWAISELRLFGPAGAPPCAD